MRVKLIAAFLSDHALRTVVLRLARAPAHSKPATNTHVVLAPSHVGNLGDEAMLTSVLGRLRQRLGERARIVLLTHRDSDDWSHIGGNFEQKSIQGWFSALTWHKPLKLLSQTFQSADTFNILGADIMDGAYSRTRSFRRILLAEWAVRCGVDTAILGFSYSDKAERNTAEYLARISQDAVLYARDAKSHERLGKIARGRLQSVADTAFLLEPASPPSAAAEAALDFMRRERRDSKRIVVFNANPLGSAMSAGAARGDESVPDLAQIVRRNVEDILQSQPDVSIVFVSHDPREPHSDARLLEQVFADLPPELQTRCHAATRHISARDVKAICKRANVAITGRMHLGIACLGAGTPCLFLDFQGKVRGLLNHFSAHHYALTWSDYVTLGACSKALSQLMENEAIERTNLAAALPRVKALAEANFERFTKEPAQSRVVAG